MSKQVFIKPLTEKEKDVAELIWGSIPLDIAYVRNSSLFRRNYEMIYPKPTIIVMCTGNSARSQMAEGYLREFLKNKAIVYSAGTLPSTIHPIAVEIMRRDGIDISDQWSKHIDEYGGKTFDYLITVCDIAEENCAFHPYAKQKFHKSFPDPAKSLNPKVTFETVRDSIKEYCKEFAKTHLKNA